jgi:threonine/homoserine/homoserine lactone efflux protein
MIQYLLLGGGLGFTAAVQPGPLQAFLFSRVAVAGWKRALPACMAPLLSDGPIAAIVLILLGQISTPVQQLLRAAGGVLLLYLGWRAFREYRHPKDQNKQSSGPSTLLQAALVNLLNPNPYIGWTLVIGPSVLTAWGQHPKNAIAFLIAFYGTLVVMMALFVLLIGTARFLGPRGQRVLAAISVIVLALLGVYLLTAGLRNVAMGLLTIDNAV